MKSYMEVLREGFEPGVADLSRPTVAEAAQISSAISLKRIADALTDPAQIERRNNIMHDAIFNALLSAGAQR